MPGKTTKLLAASLLAATAAVGTAGCGHSSPPEPMSVATSAAAPNANLSGDQLLAAFRTAAAGASSVHVVGAVKESGTTSELDLHLNRNGTTSGSVSSNGASIPLRTVNGVTYFQLTPAFLKQAAQTDPSITSQEIQAVENKWVSTQSPLGQQLASNFDGLTTYDGFISMIENGAAGASSPNASPSPASPSPTVSPTGAATASVCATSAPVSLKDLTADGTSTLDGKTVAVYKGANGSVAYFAASGPAYLEKVTAEGCATGTIDFTWNQPVSVAAPQPSEIFSS